MQRQHEDERTNLFPLEVAQLIWLTGVVALYPLGSFPQTGLPAVVVTQGGDYSLSQWHTKLERYAWD